MPILPFPLHLGQVSSPNLSARVAGALGLARKGSFLGIFPVPLHSGHLASIGIINSYPLSYSRR